LSAFSPFFSSAFFFSSSLFASSFTFWISAARSASTSLRFATSSALSKYFVPWIQVDSALE
jgi:hypothetical protein